MLRALLRMHDGVSQGRPWVRSVVRTSQLGLGEAGHRLAVDGRYGAHTEAAVKAFQRDLELPRPASSARRRGPPWLPFSTPRWPTVGARWPRI